jgi:hypothetical protein
MSALNQAAVIISEVGGYADLDLEQIPSQFERADRNGRVAAAADALYDFVAGAVSGDLISNRLPGSVQELLFKRIAYVIARAMLTQYEFDRQEYDQRVAEAVKVLDGAMVEESA